MQQPAQQPAAAPQPAVSPRYTTERAAGREHIPVHPKGFIIIRILQLVFALICLGLCGYILSIASYPAAGFMVFVAVITLIISIYNIVALTSSPKAYNYWAVLAFEIFLWIFWLCAFAYMAATCAIILAYGAYYDDYYYGYSDLYARAYKTLGSIMGAAAGIGALAWILYFVSLVMTAVFISRHRSSGLRNSPGAAAASAAAAATSGVAAGTHAQHAHQPAAAEKVEMQPQQPGMVYQQNSGYSQQTAVSPYGMPQQYPQQQQQYPQQGYPQQSMSPPPQQMSPPPQEYQQQQQYAQHSGQPQQHFGQSVSAPSVDGSAQHTGAGVPAQNTGGSYVQGNPVAFPNSHETQPVHEAHGQSYNPNAPRELQ